MGKIKSFILTCLDNGESPEYALEKLKRCLSEKLPRTSEEQISNLEETFSEIMLIKMAREERAKRLGLDV